VTVTCPLLQFVPRLSVYQTTA